ncbi:MAG TPA: 16S rRNA (cytosine(967)-C(5))-methyltransferase RsmB [Thiothrix sp.]|nr:16S rRNA (cytosine(967)-C(5))-methyltransferase RsmB [Thiothrix sp.]
MQSPRVLATYALHRVLYQGESLSDVLLDEPIQQLSGQDKALLMDMCYGALRQHERLSALLQLLLVKPLKKKDKDIEALLRLGMYQMLYQRVPDHAAINETVKVTKKLGKKWAKALINAVLRNLQRDKAQLLNQVNQQTSVQRGLPDWLFKRIKHAWGNDWRDIIAASQAKAPMSLRVNQRKISRADYLKQLHQQGIAYQALDDLDKTLESAITLSQAVNVEKLPHFYDGFVSVQDRAAQYAATLLTVDQPNLRVLDACAAPGGKTTHLAERYTIDHLTALDNNPQRLQRVNDNLQRLTLLSPPIELLAADASDIDTWWDGKPYDRILLDAPCSATGVIRRHPDIKVLRKASDIEQLVTLQQKILNALWQVLAPNGQLLYVTCSILPEENEHQVQAFLKQQKNAKPYPITLADKEKVGVKLSYGWQILPSVSLPKAQHTPFNLDGFYYALLQKTA